jgi:predicted ester cyclase
MSVAANKALVERFFEEMLNEEKLTIADEVFATDHVLRDPNLGTEKKGSAVMAALARLFHVLTPGIQVDVEYMVAEDDMVATSWTARGRSANEMADLDPTGVEVTVSGISMFRFDEEPKIRETRQQFRSLEYYPRRVPKEKATRELLRNDPLLAPMGNALWPGKCQVRPRSCLWGGEPDQAE